MRATIWRLFKMSRGRWSGWPAFAFERGTATIAFDIHLEDRGVMDEAIDDGKRHCLVGEDLSPLTERLIGGDQQGSRSYRAPINSNRTLVSA